MPSILHLLYNTLTQIDENRTLFEQAVLVDVGGAGFPKGLAIKRAQGLFANFSKTLENMEKNTIKEHKYEFNELWEGLPVDPLAKLLYDLDIDGIDEQYQEKMKKRRQMFDISNFNIYFSSLKKKEISQKYLEFLKLENNSQNWEFILDLLQLKKYCERNKIDLANEKLFQIYTNYLLDGSKKQLNMDKGERNELIKNIETIYQWN
jgi:DNA-directed RNA polymerase subunit N (RpoN/RPB10)